MEYKIVKFFNKHFCFADPVAKLFSYKIPLVILLAAMTILSLVFDSENGTKIFSAAVAASLLHFAIDEGIFKHTFSFLKRTRPYLAYPGKIKPIGRNQKDSSFPSSHMAATLAIFSIYFIYYPQYWPILAIFILFLAFSRIHDGMHYPTDILAGMALGIGYGILALTIIT
jgi:membrane-associated phospholipid phosphatase